MLNPLALPFVVKNSSLLNQTEQAMHQLERWNFATNDKRLAGQLLNEWYSSRSLNAVLNQWEINNKTVINNFNKPFKLLCYNVEGWGTRALEVIELVYQLEADVCIFTEVGELWNTNRVPHFNIFHQKGTNHSGGVCIAVGKHLKAARVETDLPNTVVIDILGLSETVRIIGIYWPSIQKRNLDDISPFIVDGTILTGDFNATVKEWGSPLTDRRGSRVKEWIEENNLSYISSTSHSSKRSKRNIDLCFANISAITSETLQSGTSDHWPLILTCENISFDIEGIFPHTNWRVFEAILVLLQTFWRKELGRTNANEWYGQYVRFVSAIKNRVTKWEQKEKYRPTLPHHIIEKLKELRKIRNKYYHLRQKGTLCEGTRIVLRVLSREMKNEIGKYKATKWQTFLNSIEQTYEKKDKTFWTYLSRIYKSRTLPFYKILSSNKVLTDRDEVTKELHKYYSELFETPTIDYADPQDVKIDSEYNEILSMLARTDAKLEKTSAEEIRRLIRTLKPKKSTGFDQISNFMIKRLPPSYIECLANCFNHWLNECKYPDEWKLAKIVTLNKLKAGVPRDVIKLGLYLC